MNIIKTINEEQYWKTQQKYLLCKGPHYSHENTEERQKKLQSQYFFKCECARCCNPDWEQAQFSALLCSFCSGPVMQDQDKCADCRRRQPLLEMVNLALRAQQLHHHSKYKSILSVFFYLVGSMRLMCALLTTPLNFWCRAVDHISANNNAELI